MDMTNEKVESGVATSEESIGQYFKCILGLNGVFTMLPEGWHSQSKETLGLNFFFATYLKM